MTREEYADFTPAGHIGRHARGIGPTAVPTIEFNKLYLIAPFSIE